MNKCPHCNNPIIVPSAVKVTTGGVSVLLLSCMTCQTLVGIVNDTS